MKSTRLLLLTGLLCSSAAFGTPVRLADVPATVRKTIDSQKGSSQVTTIDRRQSGTVSTYDVEFVSNTHVNHLVIGTDGSIIQDSRKPDSYKAVVTTQGGFNGVRRINGEAVDWSKIPQPVVKTLRSQKGTTKLDSYSQQVVNGRTIYTFAYMKSGQETYVNIADDGSFIGTSAVAASSVASAATTTPSSGLLFKDLPWTVQKPMLDQTGYANMTDVQKLTENGTTVYVGTYLKDGQTQRIKVNDQGAVVSGGTAVINEAAGASTMLAFKDLPWTVQKPMLDSTGSAKIESVNKLVGNGTTIYVGNYTQNGQNKQIQVNDQGTVLSK
ncbi:MAG: hypothetical protein JWM04_1770 [Verrucomicrobiales bacterium]|nr:hypothetical protein [Verrucomicrobiales bacterium]